MASEIRVGIIGCGAISPKHVEAISKTSGMRLVAACDEIPERAEALGVTSFRSSQLMRMLCGNYVDLVSICTPNHLHWQMARKAVSAGLDVIVEKPVSIGIPSLQEQSLCAHIFPVLQVRENQAVKALLSAIPHLGRIYSCSLVQRWNRTQAYYDAAPWRGKIDESGGSLYTQGIHYIDVMMQAMGPVKTVDARMKTMAHDVEVEDELAASFEFDSGALGTLEFSLNEDSNMTQFQIMGANGSVCIGGPALTSVDWWEVPGIECPAFGEDTPNSYIGGYGGSPANHAAIYENVADHLLRGIPIRHTLESAIPAIDFIEKAYKLAGRS
jgi:UDP-N-acetyl-2-amino-2-deoxyglucuronate dehydrogenase